MRIVFAVCRHRPTLPPTYQVPYNACSVNNHVATAKWRGRPYTESVRRHSSHRVPAPSSGAVSATAAAERVLWQRGASA